MAERLDLNGAKTQFAALEERDDRVQVAAPANQHGNRTAGVTRLRSPDEFDNARSFRVGLRIEESMHLHWLGLRRVHGIRTGIGNGSGGYAFHARHDAGKRTIDPLNDAGLRAEIGREPQRFERDCAYALATRPEEQSDFGLAETIDRLHGIANHEQRAAIVRLPACCEPFEQIELGEGGILEFIDEDVADAVVKRKQQIGWRLLRAKGSESALCDLDKINLGVRGKHELEFSNRARQQPRNRTKHLPLRIAVSHGWQVAQQRQHITQTLYRRKCCNQCCMTFLEMLRARPGFLVLSGRKTLADIDRLAPVAGFRQEQFSNADPPCDARLVGSRQLGQSGAGVDWRQGAGLRKVLRRIIGKREQFAGKGVWQQFAHVRQRFAHDAGKRRLQGVAIICAMQMPKPVIPPRKHARQQILRDRRVVVEVGEHGGHIRSGFALLFEQGQRVARRFLV